MVEMPQTVAETVIAARERRGWSQSSLAERAALRLATVQHIELGHTVPQRGTLFLMASVLNIDLDELTSARDEQSEHRSAMMMGGVQ